MFLKYLDPIFRPFRAAKAKALQAKQMPDRLKGDLGRAKAQAGAVKGEVAKGKQAAAGAAKGAKDMSAQAQQAGGAAKGAVAGAQGAAGAAAKPGVKKVGLFGKKRVCAKCGQQLDKSWDSCPFCKMEGAGPPGGIGGVGQNPGGGNQVQPAMPGSSKTAAFMLGGGGEAGGSQLMGWLIPLKGPQRGELFTLQPVTMIGTDPTCTVCLIDQFMSSKHAEIRAQGGIWILKDGGSTNGTFVNDKKIDKHELVDNDFVKFGGTLLKFKSL